MNCPSSEFSATFWAKMKNSMAQAFIKYGPVADAYPRKVDAIQSLRRRLRKYEETGNKEWLIDIANFAMIEFMHPSHADAHYRGTSEKESPGRVWNAGTQNAKDNSSEE